MEVRSFGVVAAVCVGVVAGGAHARDAAVVTVREDVVREDVLRFGVTMTWIQRWGSSVVLDNLVQGGGFEPLRRNSVLVTSGGEPDRIFVTHSAPAVPWETGLFDGGTFEVATGDAEGRTGTILEFTHEGDRLVFVLDGDGPVTGDGDVVFVRMEALGGDCPTWWSCSGDTALDPDEDAGLGGQALRLGPDYGAATYYMDAAWRDGDRSAGKLRIVEGAVRMILKARGEGAVSLRFFREDQDDFCIASLDLDDAWQTLDVTCDVAPGTDDDTIPPEGETRPILGIRVESDGGGTAWVDELTVRMEDDDTSELSFARPTLEALEALQPGVLRMLAQQLGGDLDSVLADEFARPLTECDPGSPGADFTYSLPEFLALCEAMGARPWWIIPPTFSGEDLDGLMTYLTAPRDRGQPAWSEEFDRIYLEFGNEGWGGADDEDPFWGASFYGGTRLGTAAARAFERLRAHPDFDPLRFELIIGGQRGSFSQCEHIEAASDQHDVLAVGGYYLNDVDDLDGSDDAFVEAVLAQPTLSASDKQRFAELAAGSGRSLYIYEMHLHTTDGSTAADVRNPWVTSRVGGEALAIHLLTQLRDVPTPVQNVFSLANHSAKLDAGGYVKLFGITRDMTATGRRRPAFEALKLVNEGVSEALLDVSVEDPEGGWDYQGTPIAGIDAFAFQRDDGCALFLVNSHPDVERNLALQLPDSCGVPVSCHRLSGDPLDNNEDAVAVAIEAVADCPAPDRITLPAGSLTRVLTETSGADDDDSGADDDDDDSVGAAPADDGCSCGLGAGDGSALPNVLVVVALLAAALRKRRASPGCSSPASAGRCPSSPPRPSPRHTGRTGPRCSPDRSTRPRRHNPRG